ncbi:MAG: helicase-exonuclease AddAB subunit AddA [Ruminococcaceae bacterium]|nr:helicase-exonuclease AddAB subunit AddA [Oscillospiraceae bacterium]
MSKWTTEQKWAIEARGGTLLVSAAAGSGKTAVLVERVAEILCDEKDETDADRLLIATFTRAAAEELRSRLTEKLSERIREIQQPASRMRLRRQQLLLQKAQIGTIHAFCAACLREFFAQAGITPDFRIMVDGAELELLRQETAHQLAEECFESNQPVFVSLLDLLGEERNDGAVEELILRIDRMVSAFVSPEDKLAEIAQNCSGNASVNDSACVKWLLSYAKDICGYMQRLYARCVYLVEAEAEQVTQGLMKLAQEEYDALCHLTEVMGEGDWDKARQAWLQINFRTVSKKMKENFDAQEEFLAVRDRVKKIWGDSKRLGGIFNTNAEGIARDDLQQAAPLSELCRLVSEYRRRFAEKKRERRMLDPDDLEHMTAALFTRREGDKLLRTDIARTVAQRYKYILLDEYQDTNYTQDVIFRAISREEGDEIDIGSNIFMVGDVKQSIYRFRKAVPRLFMDRLKSFAPYDENNTEYPAKIVLGANFRSRPEVTETVNFLFSQLMTEERGGIDYNDGQQLYSRNDFAQAEGMESELHIICGSAAEQDETTDIVEARYCARMIKQMLADGFSVSCKKDGKPALRPAKYGDFCIMRSSVRGGHGDAFISQMAELGIPIAIGTDSGFYSASEVRLMLSLLRAINNPLGDVALTAALLSPVFGFDCDMLALVKEYGRKRPVYSCLCNAAKEQGSLAERCAEVVDTLHRWRELACVMSCDRLIAEIYRESGLLAAVQAMPGGAGRKANLLQLQEQAREYESSGFKGLTRFIRMTDRAIEQGTDKATALVASQNSVSVRTIHSAKGLQFPVCIICGLGNSNRRMGDSTVERNVLFNSELGLGVQQRDGVRRIRYRTARFNAVRLREESEELDEKLRVLYVAMTRPVDKLIMVTTIQRNSSVESSTSALRYMVSDDGVDPMSLDFHNVCDRWIMASAVRHPDAKVLRSLAGLTDISLLKASVPLKVTVLDETDPLLLKGEKNTAEETDEQSAEYAFAGREDELRRRMDFRCGKKLLQDVPAKVTASEVHRHRKGMTAVTRPSFAKKGELTPTERGTALHRYMQFCDFDKAKSSPDDELERLLAGGFLSEREGKAVRGELKKVRTFFENTATLLAQAEYMEREWRFTAALEPELYGLFMQDASPEERAAAIEALRQSGKTVVIQGECDLLLMMKDEAVVIDYKTDHVTDSSELAEEYKAQVQLYAGAVKAVTGLPAKRCYLYSFTLGQLIQV